MSKPINQPNIHRRRLLQGVVVSTAAIVVPGVASAMCSDVEHKLVQNQAALNTSPVLGNDQVTIELFESNITLNESKLARVTITNQSDKAIKLSHVSPGAISTQKGVYQINATLSNNPLAIQPKGVYQFWLRPDDGTQARLSTKPKFGPGHSEARTAIDVTVLTNLDSGPWVGTQRVQAVIA